MFSFIAVTYRKDSHIQRWQESPVFNLEFLYIQILHLNVNASGIKSACIRTYRNDLIFFQVFIIIPSINSFCQYLWVLLPHIFFTIFFSSQSLLPHEAYPVTLYTIINHLHFWYPPSLFHILFIFSCNSLSFYVSFHKVNNCFFYLLVCPLYLVQCWSHSWCLIHISRLIIKTSKFPCFLNFAKHRLVLLCRNSAIFFVRACPVP